MIDHRIRQAQQVEEEGRQFIEETSQEQFAAKSRAKKYDPGSIFLWALGAVYGPKREKSDDRST